MVSERNGHPDDPLMYAIDIVTRANTTSSTIIQGFINTNVTSMHHLMLRVHERIEASTGSRYALYRKINPTFVLHSVYKDRHTCNDIFRMSFTRFRVSGHCLAIESGRWNRRGRGRLPIEERLCGCGAIQTERHVVEDCPISANIRQYHNLECLEDLFNGKYETEQSCKIIHKILTLYN